MNPAIVLAVLDTLTFTVPVYVPQEFTCDTLTTMTETGPITVVLEKLPREGTEWVVVDSASFQPGARGSFVVNVAGCDPCAFRTWSYDVAGNRSLCHSNIVNRPRPSDPVGVADPVAFQKPSVTPMPARNLTSVSFRLPVAGEATLDLIDVQGRRVRVLARGDMAAGPHVALFNAQEIPIGLYLVRLVQGHRAAVARFVVIH